MSRSNKEERAGKLKYSSAKAMADKVDAGFQGSYLKLPKGTKLYKPKEGKALLDVIPFEAKEGNPFADEGCLHWERTYYAHRAIGPNSEMVICPARTAKKRCPICEYRAKLSDDDEDAEEMRKTLLPKERQLINLIDLKNPDRGVQLLDISMFAFGKPLLEAVTSAEEDEDWEMFFTLDQGKTLRVQWGDETIGKGRSFVKAQRIDFKDRAEPYDASIMEDALQLDDLLLILSYDELKEKFMAVEEKPKSRHRDADDDEDDEKPKKRSRVDDDDEDEKPARSKKEDSEDDDEDEVKPRSKKRPVDDDDEDEKPKRKKPAADEDEDEEKPKGKKKPADEEDEDPADEDEDEEKPAGKKASKKDDDDDDWGDFEEKSSKRKGKEDEDEDDEEPGDDDEDEDEKPTSKKKSVDDDEDDEKPKKRSRSKSED